MDDFFARVATCLRQRAPLRARKQQNRPQIPGRDGERLNPVIRHPALHNTNQGGFCRFAVDSARRLSPDRMGWLRRRLALRAKRPLKLHAR